MVESDAQEIFEIIASRIAKKASPRAKYYTTQNRQLDVSQKNTDHCLLGKFGKARSHAKALVTDPPA